MICRHREFRSPVRRRARIRIMVDDVKVRRVARSVHATDSSRTGAWGPGRRLVWDERVVQPPRLPAAPDVGRRGVEREVRSVAEVAGVGRLRVGRNAGLLLPGIAGVHPGLGVGVLAVPWDAVEVILSLVVRDVEL